jgi:UDP-N-acetylmuramoyl-tripeptide--D-alanyl-D-alanine ligase
MRSIFKTLLKYYLKYITKIVLFIHKPIIIAISGSTNKNFVKGEIKKILEDKGFKVRGNPLNFNTEIGLPLAILYLPSGYNEYKKWLPSLIKAPLIIFRRDFPKYLVLTMGTSDEGDMKYLLSIVKPQISVITDITQRYLEGYSGIDNLVKEYKLLSQKTSDLLIINNDNERIKELKSHTEAKIKSFGFNKDSDLVIEKIKKVENGQEITIKTGGENKVFKIKRFGKHHAYALAIGIIIDKHFNIDEKKKKN